MGTKQAKPVVEFSSIALPKRELSYLQRHFKILSKSDSFVTGKISREVFIGQFLTPLFGNLWGLVVLSRLFSVLDANGNGSIEWQEFVVACYLFYYADREDKMKLVFSLFDLEANGRISKKEFKKISVTLMQKEEDLAQTKRLAPLVDMFAAFALLNFDRHNENALRYNDWRRYAEDDDLILLMVSSMKKPEEFKDKKQRNSKEDKRLTLTPPKERKMTTDGASTSDTLPTGSLSSSISSSSSSSNSSASSSRSDWIATSSDSKITSQHSTTTTIVEVFQLSPSLELNQAALVSTPRPLRISLPNSR